MFSGDLPFHHLFFLLSSLSQELIPRSPKKYGLRDPNGSFKIGGVPDLVRPRVTGYLAEPDDIQDFQRDILELMKDPGLRQQMS
jgi:hypothetical protein